METRFANYESGKKREWLIANGLGGYASSTALGVNTRAYHGLLVAGPDCTLVIGCIQVTPSTFGSRNQSSHWGRICEGPFRSVDDFSYIIK